MALTRGIPLLLILGGVPAFGLAQSSSQAPPAPKPGAIDVEEATALTQGWALLAQGLFNDASRRAAQVLASYPKSAAALTLAVEAEIARAGSGVGLDAYERWLGGRALEEPSIVRRIALVLLRELAAGGEKDAARLEALRALAATGDASAAAELSSGVETGSAPEVRALASLGNEAAVNVLIAQLDAGARNATSTIEALAQSGSKLAVAPLTARLQDRSPEVRGAAVEALGILASRYDLVERIKPVLADANNYVRIKAAAALFRLGDMSGLSLLQDLWSAEAAQSRLIAAQSMASQPGALWMDQVRRLTSAAEAEVRIAAARLIAPHDPELARRVIDQGMADQNPAVRDMAAEALTEVVATDLRSLRHLLRLPDRLARARAAGRILALVQ